MKTIPEIIDELGGHRSLSVLIGCNIEAAKQMKYRGIIPVKYWPALQRACRRRKIRGVSYSNLVELHSK